MVNVWVNRPAWVRALIVALLGFTIELASDAVAHALHSPGGSSWFLIHIYEDLASGLIFFYIGFLMARSQDKAIKDRVETLTYLNHHCRNALQVITYAAIVVSDPARKKMLDESISRVVDTLSKVSKGLPK